MDIGAYWQENKRFVTTVCAGLLVFLIGNLVVQRAYGSELRKAKAQRFRLNSDLKGEEGRFTVDDRALAQAQNEQLGQALAALTEAVAFRPRPDYVLREGAGSPSNQFFAQREQVREQMSVLASRRRVFLPEGLGLEPLKTNSVETIQRHMEALDLLDRALRCAIEAGVKRVSGVRVQLDPSFGSRGGVARVERTSVTIKVTAGSESLTRMLALSQTARPGAALCVHDEPLMVERFEFSAASSKLTEVSGEVTFLAVRVHAPETGEEEEDE